MKVLSWLAKVYFSHIEVRGYEPTKASFYLSNHRNGAVDGFVLSAALKGKFKTILGKNLTKSWFMRLFFGRNIEIYRSAETKEEMKHNKEQLKGASQLIQQGTSVLMFPEGTSHLGVGLLPVKKGAALVCSYLDDNTVIPIGLHYEKGWSFRSKVIVNIGQCAEIKGKNLTEKTQSIVQVLKSVYEEDVVYKSPKKNMFLFSVLTPIAILFFALNVFTLVVAYVVGKKYADDNNVVCLWRLLSGLPAFLIQTLGYVILSIYYPICIPIYVLGTLLGLLTWRNWKYAGAIEN